MILLPSSSRSLIPRTRTPACPIQMSALRMSSPITRRPSAAHAPQPLPPLSPWIKHNWDASTLPRRRSVGRDSATFSHSLDETLNPPRRTTETIHLNTLLCSRPQHPVQPHYPTLPSSSPRHAGTYTNDTITNIHDRGVFYPFSSTKEYRSKTE